MRALAALLLCGAALAQERAFIEVTAPKDAYYVGERVQLALRFGYDRDFFRTNVVRLFAREMEVPVQVQARLPGAPAPLPGTRHRGPRFALNDGVATATSAAEETRDGRAFAVVETLYDCTPSEAGEMTVAAPTLRYAHATEFEEDFVVGRVAKDPKQEVVSGAPLRLRILPLPEEGRPPGFRGAVGRFTVSAKASRTSIAEGETLELSFAIEGDGNATVPDLDLPGFHLFGTIRKEPHHADYHLAPLRADVKEIPAIPFTFFDPGPPAGYRTVRTDPIPLEVRPRAKEPPREPSAPPAGDATPTIVLAVAGMLVVAAVALLAWRRIRLGREAPPDPEAVRLREAFATLTARVAAGGPDLADAFAGFLAAHLRCPPAAVIGPDLAARLAAKGFPKDLASRTAATLERLVAARYGGSGTAADDLAALLGEIGRMLAPAR